MSEDGTIFIFIFYYWRGGQRATHEEKRVHW